MTKAEKSAFKEELSVRFYHFSLTLSGVTAETEGLEDKLFENGCDDALICFYGRYVYLEFDRESESFSKAILSAINDIESAGLNAKVVAVDAALVGLSDIARLTDMSRQAISMLKDGVRGSGDFPAPIQRIKGTSPLWRWSEVASWLADRGKINAELSENAQVLDTINMVLQLREFKGIKDIEYYVKLLSHPEKLNVFCH
ncbi:DNA-binding protein [Xenorhabdus khoisanae]|uniref:DNA-binding protein n=1 Tax=Xenorhabdus khoisanae TaxID=880157 RepID=A0A0J5FTF9_9GAMM|nr:DNA-binding protein [Xenorhabdus khoisanae]